MPKWKQNIIIMKYLETFSFLAPGFKHPEFTLILEFFENLNKYMVLKQFFLHF